MLSQANKMLTFKEYLIESSIMSQDAHKQAMSDYDQRRVGKTDGSKPKNKRLDQMDKRRKRKAGRSEEEEVMEANPKYAMMDDRLKRANKQDVDDDKKPSKKRSAQKAGRYLRGVGFLGKRKNAAEYSFS